MTKQTVFQQKLAAILPHIETRFFEPMAKHTSFRIGGPVEVMAFPKTAEELAALLQTAETLNIEPVILGAGTNVLAPDQGIDGLCICLKDALDGMELLDDNKIRVMAGAIHTADVIISINR